MGKSLFDFSKDKEGLKSKVKECKDKSSQIDEESVKKKINQYSKLSENELMSELYKEVGKQKASGSFDMNKLASQFKEIKPMLNDKQSANLEKILKNIK